MGYYSIVVWGKGLLSHFILSKNVVLAEDFDRRKISKVEIRSDQEVPIRYQIAVCLYFMIFANSYAHIEKNDTYLLNRFVV